MEPVMRYRRDLLRPKIPKSIAEFHQSITNSEFYSTNYIGKVEVDGEPIGELSYVQVKIFKFRVLSLLGCDLLDNHIGRFQL